MPTIPYDPLTFCFSVNVAAAENVDYNSNKTAEGSVLTPVEEPDKDVLERATENVYDEYMLYNALCTQSTKELKADGYTNQEITMVKDNTYEDLLRERGSLSSAELKNIGYSDQEIAILKNPASTDDQLRALSATLTVTTIVEKLDYHPNGWTYSTIYIKWEWSAQPFFVYKDDAAIAWSGGMAFMDYSENEKSRYTLYKMHSISGAVETITTGLTDDDNVELGKSVKIPAFYLQTSALPPGSTYFIYKGAARVALRYHGYLDWMQAQGAYAHYTLSIGGISISTSGISVSFSPSPYATYRKNDDLVCTII